MSRVTRVLPSAVALLAATGVVALSATALALETNNDPPVRFRLEGGATFDASADLDESPGDVSVARIRSAFEADFRVDARSRFALQFSSEFSFYDFDGATGLVPGTDSPLDDTYDYRIGARYSRSLEDGWGMFVGGDVRFSGEHGADAGDSVTGGGFGGVTYDVSDRLTLGIGLAVRTRLEDNARLIPIPVVDFRITDEWRLSTDGPGLKLSYTPDHAYTIYLAGRWEAREFRLDEDGPLPGGVARDERVPIVLGATWKPNDTITVDGFVGAVVWNEYEFINSAGTTIAETETDAHLTAGVQLTLKF
ncbi:MAG: hypothetical protein KIS87_07790 [Phycisphaeraceae bacterium]|nr:hypothetical protein [Phycisphaeraceae bacterium]